MTRLGLVVGGTDHFVRPLELVWQRKYELQRFQPRFVHLPFVGQRVNDWGLQRQMEAFVRDNDVTFFEWASSLLMLATQGKIAKSVVTRLHSGELATVGRVDWGKVHSTIVVSEEQERRFRRLVSAPTEVSVIPYGIDLERFHPQSGSFAYRICMVCRLVPIKRVYEVILALHVLRRMGYPYTLHVLGAIAADAEGEAALYPLAVRELIERLSLQKAVFLCGPRSDVHNWLPEMDIFVSNSYWEGLQVALLEAMACGCYCLSHRWGGAEEALPPNNLFVSEAELVEKLVAYADLSPENRQRGRQDMRDIAEARFGWQGYEAAIDQVIQQAAAASRVR